VSYRAHFGSTLRLFQPRSGFLANLSFVALFRTTTVRGIVPLKLSPHKDRAPLSKSLCSLAVIHQRAKAYCPFALSPLVSPTRTLSRVCLVFPSSYELPLFKPKLASKSSWAPFSGITSFRQLHLFRSFYPLMNPFAISSSCPALMVVALLGSSPLEFSPITPWVLYPPKPRGLEHSPLLRRAPALRSKGSLNPSDRVKPS